MPSPRGRSHTTLTDTAALVVNELRKLPGIKMIAPGIIDGKRNSNKRHITVVYTRAGCELIISGQGVQKVAVHTSTDAAGLIAALQAAKKLQAFAWSSRERKPGL
jgi:hypothetical protein